MRDTDDKLLVLVGDDGEVCDKVNVGVLVRACLGGREAVGTAGTSRR